MKKLLALGLFLVLVFSSGCASSQNARAYIKQKPKGIFAFLSRDKISHGDLEIPINPMEVLNFKTKKEIYQMRKDAVMQHMDLLTPDGFNYQPSEAVFGQIQDGKPWWGVAGYSYFGNGEQSIDGVSMQSQFLLNPFLLVGLQSKSAYRVTGYNFLEPYYPQPTRLVWNLDRSDVRIAYDVTNYWDGIRRYGASDAQQPELVLNAYNAKDLGYPFLYVLREASRHVILEDPNAGVVVIPQYIHTGGSCGYPGGCNNMSPSFAPLDIRVEQLPAVVTMKLWRQQPKDANQSPDITVVLTMN